MNLRSANQSARSTLALALLTVALLGCKAGADEHAPCDQCGVVQNIDSRVVKGEGSPASALAGAVIGGVIGHQFGSGSGKDAATAVGAVGGAVAGIEAERRHTSTEVYDVTVLLDEGGSQTITVGALNGLSIGDRVRIDAGVLMPA